MSLDRLSGTKKSKIYICPLVIVLLLMFSLWSFSDETEFIEDEKLLGDNSSPRDKLALLKAYKLIEFLDLDYDQAMEFFALYNEVENDRKEFMNKKRTLIEDIREELKKDNPSPVVINEKIEQIFEEENEMMNNQQVQLQNMNEVLEPEQMGKMIIFEEKFQEEMWRIIKDMKKDDKKLLKKQPPMDLKTDETETEE